MMAAISAIVTTTTATATTSTFTSTIIARMDEGMRQTRNVPKSWTRPPSNFFKINVDAKIFEVIEGVGIGVVITNQSG